jgi:hypothetical protein
MARGKIAKVSDLDLLRIGVYAQVEGGFRIHPGGRGGAGYRFTFTLNQIADMKNLLDRILVLGHEKYMRNGAYVSFYSKELYLMLNDMGFVDFTRRNWNVPRCISTSLSMRKEYMRSLIDSLGDVDVERGYPYIRIGSVNIDGLHKVSQIYGGSFLPYHDNAYLQWKGKDALEVCEYLEWRFNCHRNIRGAEIIRHAKWEIY